MNLKNIGLLINPKFHTIRGEIQCTVNAESYRVSRDSTKRV